MENWAQSGVIIEGDEAKYITISHNQFKDCGGKDTQSTPLTIAKAKFIKGIIIQGNVIDFMRRGFARITPSEVIAEKIVIKDNIFNRIAEKQSQLPDIKNFINSIVQDNILEE